MRLLTSKLLLAAQLVAAEEGCKSISITITAPIEYTKPKCDYDDLWGLYLCEDDSMTTLSDFFDVEGKEIYGKSEDGYFQWKLSSSEKSSMKNPDSYYWHSDYSDLGKFYHS